ncbi:MAG: replication-relaxation family protein [Planctomycetes bacterium]|nr:replication-relaxation family protein [Planctomycetota bacterium]
MITERDIQVLLAVVRYFVLNRAQIQRLCFPEDQNGRVTRRRIQSLIAAGMLSRQTMRFCHPGAVPAPVYYPSRRGCEFLAAHFGDERYLLTPTQAPTPHHVWHWLAVSDTHITFDAAIAEQRDVQMAGWLNEWDIANKDESAPEKRFRLYLLLRPSPRLVCAPDAAFLLSTRGHSKVFYLEQDRNTSGTERIAASKTPGYAALGVERLHRRHFPEATADSFTVLMVTPSARRREALRTAIRGKPGADLWRFVSAEDLTPENALHAPIWHGCESPAAALVKGAES